MHVRPQEHQHDAIDGDQHCTEGHHWFCIARACAAVKGQRSTDSHQNLQDEIGSPASRPVRSPIEADAETSIHDGPRELPHVHLQRHGPKMCLDGGEVVRGHSTIHPREKLPPSHTRRVLSRSSIRECCSRADWMRCCHRVRKFLRRRNGGRDRMDGLVGALLARQMLVRSLLFGVLRGQYAPFVPRTLGPIHGPIGCIVTFTSDAASTVFNLLDGCHDGSSVPRW
mmetsp:Transcript_49772/g.131967  ORF Transcript_49772/g.131967 Transcript_49772/m.131967 type:complete len:226 (+) Transcript_49772:892-1569(+)